MEAKDTVMRLALLENGDAEWVENIPQPAKRNIERQAEISFKAGEDKGYAHARQHCEDVIIPQAEAEAKKAGKKQARWEVGEELCCLIGNKMMEDMEAGKLLGSQLEEYMKHYLKEWLDSTTSDVVK